MKRGKNWLSWGVILLGGLTGAPAQTVLEGTVALPRPAGPVAAPPRYQSRTQEMAPPQLPTAVVYLEGSFPAAAGTNPPPTVQLLQRHMQFVPDLLPVRKGTTVEFPNGDDFYHNIFSYSKPKRFDLGRYRKEDKPASQVFTNAGVVKLYCEIHENMRGAILVLDTPYFTTTDTNGAYRLTNLPAGHFQLKAWVDEKTIYEKPVTLEAGKRLKIDFPGK
jgi:plastocyanin